MGKGLIICIKQCWTKATIYKLAKDLLFRLVCGVHHLLCCFPEWPALSFGENTKPSRSQSTLGYPNPKKVTLTYKKVTLTLVNADFVKEKKNTTKTTTTKKQPTRQPSNKTTHHKDKWQNQSTRAYYTKTGEEHKPTLLRDILGS